MNYWVVLFGKFFLTLIFIVFINEIFAQRPEIDSLELTLSSTYESRDRIEIFTQLSKKYQSVDLQKANEYADAALNLSENSGIEEFKAEIFGCFGDIAIMQDSIELARQYYETSLSLFETTYDVAGLSGVNLVLGNIASVQNNLPDAMVYYQQALMYAEKAGFETWMDNLYGNIGSLNLKAGNFKEAQKLFVLALEKATEQADTLVMANSYSNLGLTSISIMDTAQARKYLLKAQELCFQMGNTSEVAQNYMSLAILENTQGNYGKALVELRNSEFYLAVEDPDYAGPKGTVLSELYVLFGKNFIALREYDSATFYYTAALTSGHLSGQLQVIAEAAEGLSNIYDFQNKIDSSFYYFKVFKEYSDSILNEENIRKLAYQDATFRYEQKTAEETRQREQEIIQTGQNKTILISIIIGLVLVLSVLVLLLQLNRNRIKRVELEQTNLKNELEIRNKELTTHVIYQLKKNEFILNIIGKLQKSVRNLLPENKKVIEGVIQELNMDSGEEVWKEFEVRFQQVHNDFYKNLVSKYPDLTPNELKLSAFLKLNMNTKDIAAITYQTTNSIDVARSRLRQKFGISKEENLISFLSGY